MKKLVCRFISDFAMRSILNKRLIYAVSDFPGDSGVISKDKPGTGEVEREATQNKRAIEKHATDFENNLNSMSEEQIATSDIRKLANDAAGAIEEVAAKPLVKPGATPTESVLTSLKQQILNTKAEALAKVRVLEGRFERTKNSINEAMGIIQKAWELNNDSDAKIDSGAQKIDQIFTLDAANPVTDLQLKDANKAIDSMRSNNGIIEGVNVVGMLDAFNKLHTNENFKALSIVQVGADSLLRNAKRVEANNNGFKRMIDNAHSYVNALNDKANSNFLSTKDVKAASELAEKAKAAKAAAQKEREGILKTVEFKSGDNYSTPEGSMYGPQRSLEKKLIEEGNPLPNVDQSAVDKISHLKPDSETVIQIGDENITISKNEDGRYVGPDDKAYEDMHVAIFEARKSVWKKNHNKDSQTEVAGL